MSGRDRPVSGRGQTGPASGRGRGRGDPPRGPGRGGPAGPPGPGRGTLSLTMEQAVAAVRTMFSRLTLKVKRPMVGGLAARPNLGEAGQKVKVLANHFKIQDLPPPTTVFMYDVSIERQKSAGAKERETRYGAAPSTEPPPMPDRNTCDRILNTCAQKAQWPAKAYAYDGRKTLFTTQKFLGPSFELAVEMRDVTPGPPASAASQQLLALHQGQDRAAKRVTYLVKVQPTQTNHEIPIGVLYKAFKEGTPLEDGTLPGLDDLRDGFHGLDVALRQGAAEDLRSRLMQSGTYTADERKRLGPNVEAWHGYKQSLNVTQSGLTLSIDDSVTAVPVMESLITWVMEQLGLRGIPTQALPPAQVEALNRVVKQRSTSINLQLTHRSTGAIRHKLRGFTPTSAATSMFSQGEEGPEISVAQYFEQQYGIRLKYPHLPCASLSTSKKMWVPIECCAIIPDRRVTSLTGDQTSVMLREAAVRPEERMRKIMNALVNKAKLHTDGTAQAFGLRMAAQPQMMQVGARVLPQPRLAYGGGRHLDPGQKGDWNLMNQQLYKTARLESFAVVSYAQAGEQAMAEFLQELYRALREKGILVQLPPNKSPPVVYVRQNVAHETVLQQAMNRAQQELGKRAQLLFIIQREEAQVYADVKRVCDTQLGVHSQVLVASNVGLGRGGGAGGQMGRKLAGVALKVNTKLGGDNTAISGDIGTWCPALRKDGGSGPTRVMLLGADVSHPTNRGSSSARASRDPELAARQPEMPSVAAVVGSVNLDCTRYACRIYSQESGEEMVGGMEQGVYELINLWGNSNGKQLPETIIMFRDGVSESQFHKCIDTELKAIQDACARFKVQGQPYKPRVTFVTVQKRHNTRLFPGDQASSDVAVGGRSGNVRPGVVVDTDICSPKMFDFYLNSHAGIQGTNRAAKYSVLYDEVGFSADSMQMLSYWLSHTFCRCTRTVSYCPPAYYAHHAAFRGRAWMRREDLTGDTASTASGASGGGSSSTATWRWIMPSAHDTLKDTMFWI